MLLALCDSGGLAVLDGATGTILRTVAAGAAQQVGQVRSNHDGSRALVTRLGGAPTGGLALIDTTSGATVNTTVVPPAPPGSFSSCLAGAFSGATPDRQKVANTCSWASGVPSSFYYRTQLLDVETLTWGLDLGLGDPPIAIAFSPDNSTAYAASAHRTGVGPIQAIDVATGARLASFIAIPRSLTIAFAPLAPALGASVSGSRVDLQWTLPAHSPAATRYVLEAGTAPGLTDVGTLTLGPAGAVTIPAVPPGTYVVRVRAGNATGVGAASSEVTVVVP